VRVVGPSDPAGPQLPGETLLDANGAPEPAGHHLPAWDRNKKWIMDATAVAAYHAELEYPVVRLLVCDYAPQFTLVTDELALCWVHEGRTIRNSSPMSSHHRAFLEDFVQSSGCTTAQLLAYQTLPTPAEAARLTGEFRDPVCDRHGLRGAGRADCQDAYQARLLLMVLTHPEIPLHNNPAELGARARVRKRDVSFGPRTREGATAWDILYDFGGDGDQTRSQFLSLYS